MLFYFSQFLLIFSLVSSFVEKLTPESNYKKWCYILSDTNTVHFIQTNVVEFIGKSMRPLSDQSLQTRIKVYQNDPNNEKYLIYQDEKLAESNTYFFTTPGKDTYHILLEILMDEDSPYINLGMETKIFSGEANRPGIVSTNDVEVSRAENLIERALAFVKQNIAIQGLDEEEGMVYKGLYETIMKKVVFVLVLKMVATIFLMYYSNKKTKSFYASLDK